MPAFKGGLVKDNACTDQTLFLTQFPAHKFKILNYFNFQPHNRVANHIPSWVLKCECGLLYLGNLYHGLILDVHDSMVIVS